MILSYELYQPQAPKAFTVTDKAGVERSVRWDGQRWTELGAAPGRDSSPATVPTCRVCGCTDNDCSGCVARTGAACSWVEPDLCSACVERINQHRGLPQAVAMAGAKQDIDEGLITTQTVTRKRRATSPRAPSPDKIEMTAGKMSRREAAPALNFVEQLRGGFRGDAGVRSPAARAVEVALSPVQRRAHEALDAARVAYRSLGDACDAGLRGERLAWYAAACEEVDRLDPGHFGGRVRRLEPRAKYVPPFADPLAVCRQMLEEAAL